MEERIAIPQTGVVFRRYFHFLPLERTSGCMCLSAKKLYLFVVRNYSAWFSFSILDIFNETFHLLSNNVNKLKGMNTKPQNRKKCWLCRDICRSKTAARTLIRCNRLHTFVFSFRTLETAYRFQMSHNGKKNKFSSIKMDRLQLHAGYSGRKQITHFLFFENSNEPPSEYQMITLHLSRILSFFFAFDQNSFLFKYLQNELFYSHWSKNVFLIIQTCKMRFGQLNEFKELWNESKERKWWKSIKCQVWEDFRKTDKN